MKADDFEIIERYLKNLSDTEERVAVEERLSNDPEFNNVFIAEKQMYLNINRRQIQKIDQSIQDSFSELTQEGYFEESKRKKPALVRSLSYWLVSSAAVIAMLFMYANFQYSDARIFQEGNQKLAFEIPSMSRSTENATSKISLNSIKNKMAASQFADAITEISSIEKSDPRYFDAQLHLAYCHLKKNQPEPEQSIVVSNRIISESIDPIKRHSADWLKLQALSLANKDIKSELQKIINDKRHTFSKEALEVQQKQYSFFKKLVL